MSARIQALKLGGAGTLAALCLLGCTEARQPESETLPYYGDASFLPQWYASAAEVPDDFHRIPAFTLQDQQGRTLTEADFAGKLYVANFFFASCFGICPKTMGHMARLQETFAEDPDVLLLSHSVTPDTDTAPVLQSFAERIGADASRWHLVTGSREHIYSLGKRAYFADEDLGEARADDEDGFLHTENFLLVDRQRRIRGIYNGLKSVAVDQLIADLRTLQREADP